MTTLQITTNVEQTEDGYTPAHIAPVGTADVELDAVDSVLVPANDDEAAWDQGLRDTLASMGYAITGPITRDGSTVTATVEQVSLIGNKAAAAYAGVSESTWSAYVARDQAPKPDRREIHGGYARPVWDRTTLDAWKAARPGPGARTDLRD